MREILFKGFHKCENGTQKAFYCGEWHTGEWVYGAYFCLHHNDERDHIHHFIIEENTPLPKDKPIGEIQIEVAPETVCQYTGLDDKHEKKIFENDIVTIDFFEELGVFGGAVEWKETAVVEYTDALILKEHDKEDIEIIGNKFENPELLEVEE